MTPAQIMELEHIWERELGARKNPWDAALACVEHAQKTWRKPPKRKALKEEIRGLLLALQAEYPRSPVYLLIRPTLEKIEKSL